MCNVIPYLRVSLDPHLKLEPEISFSKQLELNVYARNKEKVSRVIAFSIETFILRDNFRLNGATVLRNNFFISGFYELDRNTTMISRVLNRLRLTAKNRLGAVQNLLYNATGANAFLKFKKGSVPPTKTGKNVETSQTVIVKKVMTPPSKRYQLNDWPKGQLLCNLMQES